MFESMIDDWKADHNEECSDLIFDGIEKENGKFVMYAHDNKTSYSLNDDGTGNIVLNYMGNR